MFAAGPPSISVHAQQYFVGKAFRSGYGIRCAVRWGGKTPPIFRAADYGKPGVPALHDGELRELRTIEKYVMTPTLRFVLLPYGGSHRLIVFDPLRADMCAANTGSEFYVLNGACNELYYPAEYGDSTNASTGCQAPRPWVHGEVSPTH
ncbi:MAG TPA: hypothetical protein VGZ02_00610 [Candidatus Baltobacteraceae bacterium]|nr:hypothetical protein [Candidatus Baltobacteraceae bacterium]